MAKPKEDESALIEAARHVFNNRWKRPSGSYIVPEHWMDKLGTVLSGDSYKVGMTDGDEKVTVASAKSKLLAALHPPQPAEAAPDMRSLDEVLADAERTGSNERITLPVREVVKLWKRSKPAPLPATSTETDGLARALAGLIQDIEGPCYRCDTDDEFEDCICYTKTIEYIVQELRSLAALTTSTPAVTPEGWLTEGELHYLKAWVAIERQKDGCFEHMEQTAGFVSKALDMALHALQQGGGR